MIPNTPFCSTSCWAAVTLRAGSPASSTTVRLILRFPTSPSEFAMSIRAFIPSSDAANDDALGPLKGRIAPTLIVELLTPSVFGHGFGAFTGLRFENWPDPPPLAAPAAPLSSATGPTVSTTATSKATRRMTIVPPLPTGQSRGVFTLGWPPVQVGATAVSRSTSRVRWTCPVAGVRGNASTSSTRRRLLEPGEPPLAVGAE